MKFLLLLKAPHYLRPFVGTVQQLAARGHEVCIAWFTEAGKTRDEDREPFVTYPGVTFMNVSGTRSSHRREVATVRRFWNYLRYLDEPYRGATKLRKRAFTKVWRLIRSSDSSDPDLELALSPRELRRLKAVLEYVEELIPSDPSCEEFLRELHPNALLVSPLVDLNSSTQADFMKAAARLGIATGMLVYSWDNLSTKGGLHTMPDRVFVWNRRQRREAVHLHGVSRDRVVITGAPRFDPFLACKPTVGRSTFYMSLGFNPEKHLVMYVCSSSFVSGDELPFIRRWLHELRASPFDSVRDCNVIVRPHPDVSLVDLAMPATKPDWGSNIVAAVRRPFEDDRAVVLNTTSVTPQGLFECLWHSHAVVGLNTSAEIEAALAGRAVLSVLAGDAADGQESTLHFHYLRDEHREGFVRAASSLVEHAEQLDAVLHTWKAVGRKARRQAMSLVRPYARATPVSQTLAEAIEREFSPRPVAGIPADVSA